MLFKTLLLEIKSMETRRGFVFSLDAFVAFSIALIAIYSLIYFSSVPYAYYSSLLQAHHLAKDALTSLSFSQSQVDGFSKLEYIAVYSTTQGVRQDAVRTYIGPLIPNQFGYRFEVLSESGDWETVYDTSKSSDANELHKKTKDKLSVTTQTISFDYIGNEKLPESPYNYISCGGEYDQCNPTFSSYTRNEAGMKLIRLTVFT